MAEKIKRTHAERDALLSKVFDSTLQTKDIEITEAGTMEITPDEGFFALKKVNLNVNVQGGGGESSIEYLDLRNVTTMIGGQIPLKALIGMMGYSCKFVNPNDSVVTLLGAPSLYTSFSISQIHTLEVYEVEIDFNGIYGANQDSGFLTYKDILLSFEVTEEELAAIPRITKEEFYAM